MALLEKSLIVKKSTIPGAGDGLFTRTFIPKGTRIVEYKGKTCTWKEVNHDEGRNGYIYYVKRYHVIDARYHEKSMARYANDALGLTKVKGISNNCEYNIEGLRVFIDAKRDIPAGGEILVDYGREYWAVIRYNSRLAAKEQVAANKKKPVPENITSKGRKSATLPAAGSFKANGKQHTAAKGDQGYRRLHGSGKLNGWGPIPVSAKRNGNSRLNGSGKMLETATENGLPKRKTALKEGIKKKGIKK